MPSRVLFLTGAPGTSSLEWDPSGLLGNFTAPVSRFAQIPGELQVPTPVDGKHASWRSLDFHRRHLTTGYSQVHGILGEYQGNATFLKFLGSSCADSDVNDATCQNDTGLQSWPSSAEESFLQYYEHSFAAHEEATSSQMLVDTPGSHVNTPSLVQMGGSNNEENSFSTSSPTPSSIFDSMVQPQPSIPEGGHICDLKDIPNAKHLESIQPQTVTFNLLVGVISIIPFRKIKTRLGRDIGILELVVGDETRSGFRINFWLPSDFYEVDKESGDGSLGNVLSDIRPQDILLLKNVAGAFFRGQVYGQSIRKDMTKVFLLYRNRLDRTDMAGCYTLTDLEVGQSPKTQVAKVVRVRIWVLHFVQPAKLTAATKGKIKMMEELLPPDTQ